MRRALRNGLALASVSLASLAVSSGGQAVAQTGPSTGGTSVTAPEVATGTRLAARTDPSVRQITTVYLAKMMVPGYTMSKGFKDLFRKAEQHAKAGRIPPDRQSQLKWVLKTAGSNVDRYLVPSKPYRTMDVVTGGICTGWWVTPQGHMVTGSHCVSSSEQALKYDYAALYLPTVTGQDVKGFLQQVKKDVVVDDGVSKLTEAMFTKFNTKHMVLKKKRTTVYLGSPEAFRSGKAPKLTLLRKGEDWPGLDFALLKAGNVKNLPTVPLGRDGEVRVGDTLYINGYPGTVDSNLYLTRKSKDHPTLTEGAFNAMRTSIKGVPYIQAQAPAYGGNSGGPVFSRDGNVIGMAIAVLDSERIGGNTENSTLVLPVGLIRGQLKAAGVTAVTSQTSKIYYSALDDFFANRYRAALPKFYRVLKLHPQHLYVRGYIKQAKQAIAVGRDQSR